MPFKTLLTHVVDDVACAKRLRMTAQVAALFGAQIVGLGAAAPWPYASASDGSGVEFESIVKGVRDGLALAERTFRQLLAEAAISGAWRSEVGYPDVVAPPLARLADLIVAYPMGDRVDRISYTTPDVLVMEAGLPVLLLPEEERRFSTERIMLTWKNTREARRAISAALPLLPSAKKVIIASICSEDEAKQVRSEQDDVAARLARHGVNATTIVEVDAPAAAGRRLLGLAEAEAADLIVAGGYGHSRLREWILGGVTQDLIADGRRFILLTH